MARYHQNDFYPLFIKDLLRPIKPDSAITLATAMAKEALASQGRRRRVDGRRFCGMVGFDAVRPMIVDARAAEAAKIKAKQAAELQPRQRRAAARKAAGRRGGGAAAAAAEAARLLQEEIDRAAAAPRAAEAAKAEEAACQGEGAWRAWTGGARGAAPTPRGGGGRGEAPPDAAACKKEAAEASQQVGAGDGWPHPPRPRRRRSSRPWPAKASGIGFEAVA